MSLTRGAAGARLIAVGIASASFALAGVAAGYSYETPVTEGCHESIVAWALLAARASLPAAAALASQGEDELLLDDLPFELPGELHDIAAATLLLGARDNDIKGRSGIDTQDLALVHGDPSAQQEHCLRAPEHDEPLGSEQAWAACRRFVRERVENAVQYGLDEDGWPDPAARSTLDVTLAFRGTVRVELPTFYLRMGQGLHALGDSYSHAFRTADGQRVTTLLNWVDWIEDDYDEARDGPPHMSALDVCDNPDDLRRNRLTLAREASRALLFAALDSTLDRVARLAAVEQALDAYLGFEPGCTAANRWCDAPENAYRDQAACGCALPGRAAPSSVPGLLALAVSLFALGRQRALRGRRGHRGRGGTLPRRAPPAFGVVPAALAFAAAAFAQPVELAQPTAESQSTAPVQPAEPTEPADDPWLDAFGVYASVSGALDNGALAFALGARFAATERVLVGLDAEYNPWVSWEATRVGLGAFNGYATLVIRHPVSDGLALRTTGRLGVSVLLFDLVGVPVGSTGPFLGLSLLGLDYYLGSGFRLVLDPADVALPVPRITGAPFTYLQYRLTLGLQLGS